MSTTLPRIVLAVIFPIAVFLGVATVMSNLSGRDVALAAAAKPKPLNQRLSYGVNDVAAFWGALRHDGDVVEQRFLEFDLVFPTLYGATLVASLIWLSRRARCRSGILIAPVAIGVVSDWSENLVQLEQLRNYMTLGPAGLDAAAVRMASFATATKLLSLGAAYLLLFALAVLVIRRGPRARLGN